MPKPNIPKMPSIPTTDPKLEKFFDVATGKISRNPSKVLKKIIYTTCLDFKLYLRTVAVIPAAASKKIQMSRPIPT